MQQEQLGASFGVRRRAILFARFLKIDRFIPDLLHMTKRVIHELLQPIFEEASHNTTFRVSSAQT